MPNGHPESDHHMVLGWAGFNFRAAVYLLAGSLGALIAVDQFVPDQFEYKEFMTNAIVYGGGGVGVCCLGLSGVFGFFWLVGTLLNDED